MSTEIQPSDDVRGIIDAFAAQLTDLGKPLTVLVRFKAHPGREADVRAAFEESRPFTKRDRGCLDFELSWSAHDPRNFIITERWQTIADMEAHLRTPHATKHREVMNGLVEGLPQFDIFTCA